MDIIGACVGNVVKQLATKNQFLGMRNVPSVILNCTHAETASFMLLAVILIVTKLLTSWLLKKNVQISVKPSKLGGHLMDLIKVTMMETKPPPQKKPSTHYLEIKK
jgi:hypothetical protein